MATKPTGADTVPDWPSLANFTVGPSTGQPTFIDPTPFAANGHIEGVSSPTDCRVQNGWQKRVGKWARWVESGSSTGAADAHVVETDADGKTRLQALDIDGTTPVAGPALSVTGGSSGSEVGYFARDAGDVNEAVVSIAGPSAEPWGVYSRTVLWPAFRGSTTGAAPLQIGVQLGGIPDPGQNSGAIWFYRDSAVMDTIALRAKVGNRTWVMSMINQHVRLSPVHAGPTAITPVSTWVPIFNGIAFPSNNEVIDAITLEVTITLMVDTLGGGAANLELRVSNLGAVKFTAPIHVEGNIQDSKVVRRQLLGVAGPQDIDLDIQKTTAGVVSVSNVIMTVETMY